MAQEPLSTAERLRRVAGLYAICDLDAVEARGLDWFEVARAQLAGGAGILQLRAKGRADAEVLEKLARLRALVDQHPGALLVANDRPDLARLAGADVVHLGQDDLPAAEVLRLYPELQAGLSTHDEEQFEQALTLGLDYVALGPIFATTSKPDASPVVGLERLAALSARARAVRLPVVAIGGISEQNLDQVRELSDFCALIGALLPTASSESPYEAIAARTALFVERLR